MVARLKESAIKARAIVKGHVSNATQLAGLAVFTVGAFTLAPWLGWMVAGVLVSVVGWAIDK